MELLGSELVQEADTFPVLLVSGLPDCNSALGYTGISLGKSAGKVYAEGEGVLFTI